MPLTTHGLTGGKGQPTGGEGGLRSVASAFRFLLFAPSSRRARLRSLYVFSGPFLTCFMPCRRNSRSQRGARLAPVAGEVVGDCSVWLGFSGYEHRLVDGRHGQGCCEEGCRRKERVGGEAVEGGSERDERRRGGGAAVFRGGSRFHTCNELVLSLDRACEQGSCCYISLATKKSRAPKDHRRRDETASKHAPRRPPRARPTARGPCRRCADPHWAPRLPPDDPPPPDTRQRRSRPPPPRRPPPRSPRPRCRALVARATPKSCAPSGSRAMATSRSSSGAGESSLSSFVAPPSTPPRPLSTSPS